MTDGIPIKGAKCREPNYNQLIAAINWWDLLTEDFKSIIPVPWEAIDISDPNSKQV